MTGGPSAAHRDCPFPGLRPFRRGEDPLFFGRAQEIGELRSALLGERRFVAVVGSSGCGKSSLIEAGLLPRLLADGVDMIREIPEDRYDVDDFYDRWKANPPSDLISNAAIARELWLMAETETEAGRAFWQRADKVRE